MPVNAGCCLKNWTNCCGSAGRGRAGVPVRILFCPIHLWTFRSLAHRGPARNHRADEYRELLAIHARVRDLTGFTRPQTIRATSRLPQACAYLRSVTIEGDPLSLRSEASRRLTALFVVPMRVATSSCVKPDCLRASSSAPSVAYSSSRGQRRPDRAVRHHPHVGFPGTPPPRGLKGVGSGSRQIADARRFMPPGDAHAERQMRELP